LPSKKSGSTGGIPRKGGEEKGSFTRRTWLFPSLGFKTHGTQKVGGMGDGPKAGLACKCRKKFSNAHLASTRGGWRGRSGSGSNAKLPGHKEFAKRKPQRLSNANVK